MIPGSRTSFPQPEAVAVASAMPAGGAPQLCEWIGFKWLMGVRGRRLDVERLQTDGAYRTACLAEALALDDAALRGYAERLQQRVEPGW